MIDWAHDTSHVCRSYSSKSVGCPTSGTCAWASPKTLGRLSVLPRAVPRASSRCTTRDWRYCSSYQHCPLMSSLPAPNCSVLPFASSNMNGQWENKMLTQRYQTTDNAKQKPNSTLGDALFFYASSLLVYVLLHASPVIRFCFVQLHF